MGALQLPAGYPIHRIPRPLGIAQLVVGTHPLGLINNPISWTRSRREEMDAEAGGSWQALKMFDSALRSAF